jgi:hypothetical protein
MDLARVRWSDCSGAQLLMRFDHTGSWELGESVLLSLRKRLPMVMAGDGGAAQSNLGVDEGGL